MIGTPNRHCSRSQSELFSWAELPIWRPYPQAHGAATGLRFYAQMNIIEAGWRDLFTLSFQVGDLTRDRLEERPAWGQF